MKRTMMALAAVALAACTDEQPTQPNGREALLARYGALSDSLRVRVTRARFFTAVAIDSLPANPGTQRVRVEFRELERAADSLALVTAQERALWGAK